MVESLEGRGQLWMKPWNWGRVLLKVSKSDRIAGGITQKAFRMNACTNMCKFNVVAQGQVTC